LSWTRRNLRSEGDFEGRTGESWGLGGGGGAEVRLLLNKSGGLYIYCRVC
jgi:hypothetical protein